MASAKQRKAAQRNIRKAATAARKKRTVAHLPKRVRTALGKEGAKAVKNPAALASENTNRRRSLLAISCALLRNRRDRPWFEYWCDQKCPVPFSDVLTSASRSRSSQAWR